ncbi:hypothetical protein GGR57DRAFT_325479 [Xylariaceae sp. FL1272]|nr:hypothetical protein GGR57DRAFT_325479 [Xylariaceae sp. FL1272]
MEFILQQRTPESAVSFPPIENVATALWGAVGENSRLFNGQPATCLKGLPAYSEYFRRQWHTTASNADGRYVTLRKVRDIYEIADLLLRGEPRESISLIIREKNPAAAIDACENSIDLAVRLLLMLKVGVVRHEVSPYDCLIWDKGSLASFVCRHFNQPPILDDHIRFSKNFNAWSIDVIGGVEIVFTDNIADHLLLINDDSAVLIFHHASFLEYQKSSCLFPDGFVNETLRTLALLFPQTGFRQSGRNGRRNRAWFDKLCTKHKPLLVDRRVALCGNLRSEERQIERFTFWRDRLIVLKEAYDDARPNTLRQWWHDRRNGERWFTFWVAVLVLIITTTIGLLQVVESALQVYKAYHPN